MAVGGVIKLVDNKDKQYVFVNVSEYETLNDCISDLGVTPNTVVINSPTYLNAQLTVPSNIELIVSKQGYIDTNTFDLTISGEFSCGDYTAFIGTGAVYFGVNGMNKSVNVSLVSWFDVKADGSDESVNIQKAIDSLVNGGVCKFGVGYYTCSNIVIKTEVILEGVTSAKTIFLPASNNPIFIGPVDQYCVRFGWKNLGINGIENKETWGNQDGINLTPTGNYAYDTIVVEDVVIESCGGRGWYSQGTGAGFDGHFIQRLMMTRVICLRCKKEAIWLDGEHFETTFRDVWATESGDKVTYANAWFGDKVNGVHSVNRLTWIGGGITQTTLNTESRYITDANITASEFTLTSATANFSLADVGTPVVLSTIDFWPGGSPAHITTIASYVNPTTVTLVDAPFVSIISGNGIINTPKTGGLVINGGVSINLVGIEFEECGSYIIAKGSPSQGINVIGGSFISSHPSMSAVWLQDLFYGKLTMTGWSMFMTDMCLWGVVGCTSTGYFSGAFKGINVDEPVQNGQIVYSLIEFYDYDSYYGGGVVSYDKSDIPILKVNGTSEVSGSLHTIIKSQGNGTAFKMGQTVTIVSWNDSLTIKHGTGNIYLRGGVDVTLQQHAWGSDSVTLMWDSSVQKWLETSRSL